MVEQVHVREPFSNAEFCRFAQEAHDMRALADSAYVLVRALVHGLERSMRLKADGSRHARNCFNWHVNAGSYPCSDACVSDNTALRDGRLWLWAHAPVMPRMKVPGSHVPN